MGNFFGNFFMLKKKLPETIFLKLYFYFKAFIFELFLGNLVTLILYARPPYNLQNSELLKLLGY